MSNFQQITNTKLDSVVTAVNNSSTISHSRKSLLAGTNPVESLSSNTDKHAVLIQGVDANSSALSQINNLRVDGNGTQYCAVTNSVNIAPANSVNGELSPTQSFNVSNSKITSGNDVISAGGNLQQVLIYGKKADNTLQPLECSGDRLLVDVVELAQSGRITTSTALSSMQVCGFDTSTSKFKTLACDAAGRTTIVPAVSKSSTEITLDKDDLALSGSLASGNQTKWVDIGAARSIRVMCNNLGGGGGTITLGLEGSQSVQLGDFELIDEKVATLALSPSAGYYIAFKLLDCPYGYIRLRNDTGSPITFGKLNVNLIN